MRETSPTGKHRTEVTELAEGMEILLVVVIPGASLLAFEPLFHVEQFRLQIHPRYRNTRSPGAANASPRRGVYQGVSHP
jgi:hypothetical protein